MAAYRPAGWRRPKLAGGGPAALGREPAISGRLFIGIANGNRRPKQDVQQTADERLEADAAARCLGQAFVRQPVNFAARTSYDKSFSGSAGGPCCRNSVAGGSSRCAKRS